MSTGRSRSEGPGWKAFWLVVLVLALLLGGGYAAAGGLAGERVPRGTTVAGVDIGGRMPSAAEQVLREQLGPRADASFEVEVGGRTEQVTPGQAGLAVDYAATVAETGAGTGWSPQRLWNYWTGGDEVQPVVTIDDDQMGLLVQRLDALVGRDPVDGAVQFRPGGVHTVKARDGLALSVGDVRSALLAAYLTGSGAQGPSVDLELTPVAPAITDDDVDEAMDDFANPAMSGPVVLEFGRARVTLRPHDYATALSLTPDGDTLRPDVDTDVVLGLVGDATTSGDPVDASIEIRDGKPRIVRGKPGVDYDPDEVAKTFLRLLTKPEERRSGQVTADVVKPDVTAKDLKKLKIKQKVSSFTTYYPDAEYRNVNIGRAAELVDGTILKPGQVFSMNDIVGERTRANGFTEGYVISNGILKKDLGGGVSQLATTLFNAAFFAGLKDVEHKPHSFYIDRYPVGREATVVWGSLDLKFADDTPYGVYVSAKVTPSTASSQGVVTVTLYSTKRWDITTDTSDRYDYTQPTTRTLRTPDCYAYSGSPGFSIDVYRYFRRPGEQKVVKKQTFHTVYTPSDGVRCQAPKKR
ncbi:VanW family protein [Nocardioides acrostichi]|uniref:VanW family protein n=1 Tax=Nocardioides acrostichi TaxID=2784339 RepID=A0A930V389_9ACTN|nr:VanW family protein [Nocardioides acrostichi]MBF4162394.1 VanW family protein [Nocardioides acrostichi]